MEFVTFVGGPLDGKRRAVTDKEWVHGKLAVVQARRPQVSNEPITKMDMLERKYYVRRNDGADDMWYWKDYQWSV